MQVRCFKCKRYTRLFVPDLGGGSSEYSTQSPAEKTEGLSQLILARGRLAIDQDETKSSSKRKSGKFTL